MRLVKKILGFGSPCSYKELNPVNEFPPELPYMGSAFFFTHADGRGNLFDMAVSDDDAYELVRSTMKQ